MKKVLVTGGAGFVGSHCCKAFSTAGWNVVVFDNLCRGAREAVKWGPLIEGDVADAEAIGAALRQHHPDLVAHFAAYAYVGESVTQPHLYYGNNSCGSRVLLDQMMACRVSNLIFSSTCATYGVPIRSPIDEDHPQVPINPYGWSKLIVERMLGDYHRAYNFNSASLRYFNAAGCDPDAADGAFCGARNRGIYRTPPPIRRNPAPPPAEQDLHWADKECARAAVEGGTLAG
jgi:UDP-arabinose 4-epimerase